MSNIWITDCGVWSPSPRHETFILVPKCCAGAAAKGQLQEIGECRKVYVTSKHLLFHPLCKELRKERPSSLCRPIKFSINIHILPFIDRSFPSLWMPRNSRLYIIWYESLWRLWRGCSRPQTVGMTTTAPGWRPRGCCCMICVNLQLQHPLSGVSSAALT